MSHREFNATRTMLANAMATAGAELLEYMGVGAALAAIPNTEPPKYVVAGTLQMIAKMLPGLESTAVSPDPAAAGTRRPTIRAAIEKALEGRHIEDGTVDAFNDVIDAIEREVLAAHAGVTAEPAGRGQTDETDISARLRQRAAGAMANQDDAKLMLTAADECNRFYNGMMNWKANAQAKDRTIIELRETSKAAQVPAAEVRAQALGDAIEEVAKVGALWIDNSNRDTAAPILSQAIAAIRSLAQQSTADKADDARAIAALPGWERGIATVTMNGHQLREALEFINPGGDDDADERDNDLTFGIVQHEGDDGNAVTGLCCWNDDSDGVLPLSGEPSTADKASEVRAAGGNQ